MAALLLVAVLTAISSAAPQDAQVAGRAADAAADAAPCAACAAADLDERDAEGEESALLDLRAVVPGGRARGRAPVRGIGAASASGAAGDTGAGAAPNAFLSALVLGKSSGAGYRAANDTEAFLHHLQAFQQRDMDGIMLDYTNQSLVLYYDFSGGKTQKYLGLSQIRTFFDWVVPLVVTETLTASATEVRSGMGWFVWGNPEQGVISGTDSIAYDEQHHVGFQSVVITSAPGSSISPVVP